MKISISFLMRTLVFEKTQIQGPLVQGFERFFE
jgi:hypothetical protein